MNCNPATLNPLGPRTASRPPSYGAACIGARRTVRHSAGFERFSRCSMLAFSRDPFVTSYKWLDPVTVDALDMDNGLVLPSFGAHSTFDWAASPRKPQFWVRVLLTAVRWRPFVTRS